MKEGTLNWKVLLFLYTLSVLMLWEWFLPIMELTDFGYPSLFLLYAILFFTLALFDVVWWLSAIVQLLYIMWTIHYIYFNQLMFSIKTVGMIFTDIKQSFSYLMHGDIGDLSNLFRTLLLFALIWMVAYLIRHWIEVRHSMMVFFSFTVIFVALIDTFSPYDASASIVRIMMIGLLTVGFTALVKLADEQRLSLRTGHLMLLSLPMLLLIATAGLLSRGAPVHPPAWPDPVPFLMSLSGADQEAGEGNSKSGYDPDDSELGGAFVQDHQPVFEAAVDERQYWRIETKDTYTSKGWQQEQESESEVLHTNENLWTADETEPSHAKLQFSQTLPFLVTPYGTRKVLYPEPLPIMHEAKANRLFMLMGEQEEAKQYEVEFVQPEYSMSELEKAEMLSYETIPEDLDSYLQLPDELPERVKELALSLTEPEMQVYEKIKAVEQYFKHNGFVYETQDVPMPDEGQDYVDQFLFETKKGYCDNFSTSMAVMLRSAGIPTRWVKGFAPGELAYKSSGKSVYRVTNDEAHSWVEAYIPEVGWMPFEPTIGFSHPTDIKFDTPNKDPEEEQIQKPVKPEAEKQKPEQKKTGTSPIFGKVKEALVWFFTQWWLYAVLVLLIAGGGVYAYRKRTVWLPKWKIRQFRKQPDGWEKFEQQYKEILLQLKRTGLPKDPAMTLSDYSVLVDRHYGGDRMSTLTAAYERGVYGKERSDHDWLELNEVWEDLIISATC